MKNTFYYIYIGISILLILCGIFLAMNLLYFKPANDPQIFLTLSLCMGAGGILMLILKHMSYEVEQRGKE